MEIIQNVMIQENFCIDVSASIQEVVQLMFKNHYGVVILCLDKKPVGIATERDLLLIINNKLDLDLPISNFINSQELISIHYNRSVEYALHLCVDHNIRRLIIVDDHGDFLGVVPQEVLIQYLEDETFKTNLLLSQLTHLSKKILTINHTKSISDAIIYMKNYSVGSVVVVDDSDDYIGIFTERDLIRVLCNKIDLNSCITNVMSAPIIVMKYNDTVLSATKLMQEQNIRHIMVVDENQKAFNIISSRDIARTFKGSYGELIEIKLKNVKKTLNYIKESIFEVYEDDDKFYIQWGNDKAIEKFGKNIVDKSIFEFINKSTWEDIYYKVKKYGELDNFKIKIDDMYFDLSCTYNFNHSKQSILFILKDITQFEYALIDANKLTQELKKELSILQGVIDQQNNMVMVTNGDKIISANKSLFNFFNVHTLEDFENTYGNISNTFITHDSFFYVKDDNQNWIEKLLKTELKDRIVSIVDISLVEPKAFTIQLSKLNTQDEHYYVITFTDITDIKLESQKHYYHATHDALTGIYNRSYYLDSITMQIQNANRYETPFCVVMLDIDHFKRFNDTYGHLVGDKVLVQLSSLVKQNTRKNDVFARWGGEEFIILLTKTSLEKAELIAQNLRKLIENMKIDGIGKVTSSFGVTQFIKDDTEQSILKRVDDALYEAKQKGRNIVVSK